MRETKTQSIGGLDYTVTQLGATQGRKVFTRLAKLMGQAAGSTDPIAGMVAGLNDDDISFLCDAFSSCSTVKIENRNPALKDVFEEHFAGKYMEMLKWLWFSVEVNYGPFLRELGLSPDQLGSRLSSLKGATGLSGDSSMKVGSTA